MKKTQSVVQKTAVAIETAEPGSPARGNLRRSAAGTAVLAAFAALGMQQSAGAAPLAAGEEIAARESSETRSVYGAQIGQALKTLVAHPAASTSMTQSRVDASTSAVPTSTADSAAQTRADRSVTRATSSLPPEALIAAGPTVNVNNSVTALGTDSIAVGLTVTANGKRSVAMGSNALASAEGAVSVGYGTVSGSVRGAAFGYQANVVAANGLALGYLASVNTSGVDAIAIGSETLSNNNASIGIGRANVVDGKEGVVLGNNSAVAGDGSYALGNRSHVNAANTFVIGSDVLKTEGANSVVLGSGSDGSQNNVVSIGAKDHERRIVNVAAGKSNTDAVNLSQLKNAGLAIDSSGNATNAFVAYDDTTRGVVSLGGTQGTVIRNVAKGTTDTDAVNLGQLKNAGLAIDSSGNAANAFVAYDDTTRGIVSLGGTQGTVLRNVAKGTTDTDAVNLGQLKNAGLAIDSSGNATNAFVAYEDATKSRVSLGGTDGTVLSNVKAGVADRDAVNVAQLKEAGLLDGAGKSMAAVVYDTHADGTVNRASVTLGGASAGAPVALRNVAAGRLEAGSTDAVNGDQLFNAVSNLQNGGSLKYFATNSTLGAAQASGANSTAIGANALASASNAVALGANAVADRADTVSVGAAGQERQITNVKAGTADTDAVNVSQLKSVGLVDSKGNTATALTYDTTAGGAANLSSVTLGKGVAGGTVLHNVANGTLAGDAVNVGQLNDAVGKVTNVAITTGAFFSADGNASTETASATGTHAVAVGATALASGANSVATGAGASASADNSVALGAGSVANRASSVSVGSAGSERQITNVAAGKAGTDAVNLDQLNRASGSTLGQANSYTDQRFNNTQQQIRDLDHNTRKGIAAASALNVVTPYLPGRTAVNAGVAAYRGQAALGIGVSRWNEKGNFNFNAGVSSSGGNSTIVRAGIGYVFGN
jgi:autotransporter adhesin